MDFQNLTAPIRAFMVEELDRDIANDSLYLSPRLNAQGRLYWPDLLGEAFEDYSEAWLAEEIRRLGLLNPTYVQNRKTGPVTVTMPVNAPNMLAEGEFNRFYIRGVCRFVLSMGADSVIAYRAKAVSWARRESEAALGKEFNAEELLEDIRRNPGADTDYKIPGGPNSGISVKPPPDLEDPD